MTDSIRTMFNKINRSNISNSFYCLPKKYIDCRQLLQERKKKQSLNQNPQQYISQKTKEKLFKKKFYLDQSLRSTKDLPGPNQLNITPSARKLYKSQSIYIQKPQQSPTKKKRDTWVDDIQRRELKYNEPSVGQYNLLTDSGFNIRKQKSLSLLKANTREKLNTLDDVQYASAQIPGPGSHNPHKIISKLKINPITLKDMLRKKHAQQKISKKLSSSKLSSGSYDPVIEGTFDSIKKKPKQADHNMKIIQIQVRKGRRSLQTVPNLFKHASLNQWTTAQNFYKEKQLGKVKIFNLTSNSFGKKSVYH